MQRDKCPVFCLHPQARLAELDTPRRLENLQKLEELKRHLMDLEKQVRRVYRAKRAHLTSLHKSSFVFRRVKRLIQRQYDPFAVKMWKN